MESEPAPFAISGKRMAAQLRCVGQASGYHEDLDRQRHDE